MKGRKAWNKGLTKDTNHKIAEQAKAKKGIPRPFNVGKAVSAAMLKLWKDPAYVSRQMKARGVTPNKSELKLLDIITSLGFRFVGDGQLIIAGKCPDYWDGNNKLIEFYGNYWHSKEEEKKRVELFKNQGYDCLIIWEHELINKKEIIDKVSGYAKTNN